MAGAISMSRLRCQENQQLLVSAAVQEVTGSLMKGKDLRFAVVRFPKNVEVSCSFMIKWLRSFSDIYTTIIGVGCWPVQRNHH